MRELLVEFKNLKGDHCKWLKEILYSKREIEDYSEFFKFLTGVIKIHPDSLEIVIERILEEWQDKSENSSLFKSTVSFLGRLKKTLRKQKFKGQISRLWPAVFSFPGQDRLKLHLVREYRRELPFGWLYEFVLRDVDFFYSENLNSEVMDTGAMALLDILIELLDKSRGEMDELRVSGLLEKIGSLWRSPALNSPDSKIMKLLAMASSISGTIIFDSLPGLMDSIMINCTCNIWCLRLVDSVLKKYPKRQYILSQSRAELNLISKQVIQITSKAIDFYAESVEMNKTICGLVKSVLERWEGMACSSESEAEFFTRVSEFLESSYKSNDDFSYNLLNVFANHFIDSLIPQISSFFRNSLKLSAKRSDKITNLSCFVKILVNDGGCDRAFPLLFKEYPSLIADVHEILSVKGNEMDRLYWLLILADSPRTKKVLIDFLIDPKQINEIESSQFWMNFMIKLTRGINFDEINKWSKGFLLNCFLLRMKKCDSECFDEYFYDLLKLVIEKLSIIANDDLEFILISCKTNLEMFNWILSKFNCKEIILNNMKNFMPFGVVARKVYEIVKNDLKPIDELIDCLFQCKDEKLLIKSIAQWNLLIESKNLNFLLDEQVSKGTFFTEDYGVYLEKLFKEVRPDDNYFQLMKESDDPIEMFLEYYKYGQIRSMRVLQNDLLVRFRCSELLLRIPLTVLRASGPEFGGVILDSLLLKGLDEGDVQIVMSKDNEHVFELLKIYYKSRIDK